MLYRLSYVSLPVRLSNPTEFRYPETLERVAGIEPASSAWKAEVLPLNYTRRLKTWWWGKDLNLRRLSRQIYSLIPLTTREPLLKLV